MLTSSTRLPLSAKAPAIAQAPSAIEPAPSPEPTVTTAAPGKPARGSFEVEVRSVPRGARILVDGKPRGVTPAKLRLAKPTSILVRHAGYRAARVRAERTGPVDVRLVRVRGAKPKLDRDEPPDRETLD